jgi:hypothetical protein
MASRIAWAIVLVVGLAGCGHRVGIGVIDSTAVCLEQHPGDVVRCCYPGDHVERTICCPPGSSEVADVEHADWSTCVFDETGADATSDAGADAP